VGAFFSRRFKPKQFCKWSLDASCFFTAADEFFKSEYPRETQILCLKFVESKHGQQNNLFLKMVPHNPLWLVYHVYLNDREND
jgi:hypothetical protein